MSYCRLIAKNGSVFVNEPRTPDFISLNVYGGEIRECWIPNEGLHSSDMIQQTHARGLKEMLVPLARTMLKDPSQSNDADPVVMVV